ncbi:MAG: DUF4139 domain-containing protein [Myxococcota bacterium]
MQPITTRVESVTLYHRGATVRRTAELDLSAGAPPELFVVGLPLSLVDHTVRVRLETGGEPLLLSNVRVGLHAPPRGTPPTPPEEKALREVRDALAAQHQRLALLEQELARYSQVSVLPRPDPEEGKLPAPAPMGARAAFEGLFEEAVASRLALMRTARDEVKRLEERQRELERALQLASTATHVHPDELTKSVSATLAGGATPKKAKLVLEYFVLGARWAPAYQCRMTRDCRSADLVLRALVCQRTGEDWKGVTLQLSTAAPMSWTELPELAAQRIGRAQPPPPSQRGFRPPPQGAASLFQDYDRGLASARAALPIIPSWAPPLLEGLRPLPKPADHFASADLGAVAESVADFEEEAADDEVSEKELRRERKMVAPPPPPAAPMMSAPAPAPAMRAAASGMAMPGGAPMKAKKLAGRVRDEAPAEALSDGAQLEVLLYASLRLGGATGSGRGALTPVDRRQALLESLQRLGLTVTFDVLALVERAEAQGHEVFSVAAPAGSVDVRAEAGWYDYVYGTEAAVDVPSDGTFHSVPVNTRTATSDVLYVTVPREDPQVYRQAMVRNPLASPLLPGQVEVSVGGEYVLTTTLPSVAPGGDFKLSLGVEQGIKVARNARFSERRSGDKVVATNELIHELSFEVVNNLERAAKLEVRERVPQPAPDAEVVVDEGTVKPAWEKYTQEERGRLVEGGRRWVFTVEAGQSQKLEAEYRVKLYANNELVGGNRREA